jgi:hypothetical protein
MAPRPMPYLIDGSNLGGRLGGRAGARDPEAVVDLLLPWSRDRGRVVVVFDGAASARLAARYGPLEIVWSGPRSADAEIVARVGAAGKDSWIVVTADRELARRCRDAGARVESPTALAERAATPPRAKRSSARAAEEAAGKPPLNAAEREYWRRRFAGEDEPEG